MLYLIPIFVGIGVNEYKEYVRVPIEFTVLFLCAVGFYVYVSTAADVGKTEPRKQVQIERGRRNELEASVENGVKNGYKFYANNDKVELSDVDLSEYSIKIDAEKKKIILSRRWFYMIKHLVQIYTYAGLSAICIVILSIVVWMILAIVLSVSEFKSLTVGLCFAVLTGLILLVFETTLFHVSWKLNRLKNEAVKERNKLEADVKNGAKNGYRIYVDGIEVEYDNIDLSKYSIKIDTKKKKIILSK